ncbi:MULTISPECIES: DegT/DnrJ/EryC1/StrS aminotransferase family protein [Paraliobacillus]|uniref:DegT/DnrJ/EryC1/StrS family aminotransferase n=1 Tax=Paraliobacillus TaxID=200903 RepID=UPI000DD46926|nr:MULTISPECIES: DegT/DnrJ/EryC1/StrS family aminotransferase [Paraliobacillus]
MIRLIDLKRQYQSIETELLETMKNVLQSGNFILGPEVAQLEKRVATNLLVSDAITVASGTDALILTLHAYGIGKGDEVITSPFTFIATAEAISRIGARPVFADVDSATGLIDPAQIRKHITRKTKCIIPIHLFGQAAEMDQINQIAKDNNLIVIEDACQAYGATYKDRPVGSLGDAACFSFFPTKNLGGIGDGGIVTTNNTQIANRIRQLRVHGSNKKYYHDEVGYNSRLDSLQAAILLVCLDHIDNWNEKRRKAAKVYIDQLSSLSTVEFLNEKQDNKHVYHLFCLKSTNRDAIITNLKKNEIAAAIYYPCCLHLQKAYADLHYQVGDFPEAETLSKSVLSIPMHPFLTNEEQRKIINSIKEVDLQ